MKRSLAACIVVALTMSADAWAQAEPVFSTKNSEEESTPWQEIEVPLPTRPRSGSLVEFYVSATTRNRFFLDDQSIDIGADGVVRYILVIRSAGADSTRFEGVRCQGAMRRIYAFARADGSWSPARNSAWQPVARGQTINREGWVLAGELMCRGNGPRAPKESIVQALRDSFSKVGDPSFEQSLP
ncbi:MAG: hypothetical protein AMXMBFR6_11180 [Betaproteobacteria bacterium]